MSPEVGHPLFPAEATVARIERLVPPVPPLLEGVGRVLVATENEKKLQAVRDLLNLYPVIRGTDVLAPQAHEFTGEEPPWDNAVLVARDKVENVVNQIRRTPGPETLVIASDIVIWFNGKPYQNLSRVKPLTREREEEEVRHLQSVVSQEFEVMWDVATAASRPGLRVTLADRHVARFSPIHPDRVSEAREKDRRGFQERNSRIQLLEEFPHHVLEISTLPFFRIADRKGEFCGRYEWACSVREGISDPQQSLPQVLAQVVGGLPVNGRLNDLLHAVPNPRNGEYWELV